MRTFKRAFGVALAFAVVLFQQSCDNSYGIFEEVQKEREQKGQDIYKKKSVTNIVRFGGDYYASTASLYRRAAAAGSDWSRVDGLPGSCVFGLAELPGTLYASTDSGVYSSPDGSSWTALAGAPTGIEKLFTTTDDELFLVRHAVDTSDPVQSTYTIYHYSAGTFNLVAGFAPATDKTIRGVAFYGGAYWFASEDLLYSFASADGGASTDHLGDFAGLSSGTIWNLCAAGSYSYVTTKSGAIYRLGSTDGVSASSIALTAVASVPMNGTDNRLIVGTQNLTASSDSKGYLESAAADSIATFSSSTFVAGESGAIAGSSSVYSTTVYDLPVNALLYDGNNASGTLLVGISSYTSSGTHYGLYSSRWTGSSWLGWEAE
jgi:hypothetical protein